jgi:glutathione S-transferase
LTAKCTKIEGSLKAMSQGLGERAFCAGAHFSLADVAVGCALSYLDFRFAQVPWRRDHDNLAQLYEKLAKRQSFMDTQPA